MVGSNCRFDSNLCPMSSCEFCRMARLARSTAASIDLISVSVVKTVVGTK